MDEAKIDGRESQGLINNPQAAVDQQYGDRQTANTDGGDYAGRTIDKRSNTFIINLLGTYPAGSISQQSLQELVKALEQITDDQSVKRTYQEVLPPDAEVSRPIATSFEGMVNQLQEFRRLQPFLQRLAEHPDTPETIRKQLNKLRQLDSGGESQEPQNASANERQSGCQAYLQIVLRPDLSSDGLVVNAWLIPDDTVQDPAKRYQPLDLDETQKGASCQIEAVPQVLNQFLNQALQYLRGQRYELTIEVFLPLDHLCADVDAWELADLFFEEDTYLLGTKYPVVVRSQERLDPRYLASRLNQWYTNWDRVKMRLSSISGQDDFEYLSQMDACNWKQLVKRLKQKLGLKLTCGLVDTQKKDLFTCLLKAALPIAIWPRLDLPEIDQGAEIEQLVASGPLLKLLTAVRQKREEADCADCPDSHLGSHLAVMWEDPYRLTPDALAQLRPPGQ
ncbi:MAG: hypothetical protein ACFBSF_16345 [Leptolyngbyaceae cyanobacterium]